jgi:hypothetical protein
MELKKFLLREIDKANNILNLYKLNEINIIFDKLNTEKETDQEVLYYKNGTEKELMFLFGFDFFVKEIEDQQFKKLINEDALFFRIIDAYFKAKKKYKKVKISDILNEIQNKEKDSLELHKYLEKILTQSYYLGWSLERDKKDFEEDFFIEIPDRYMLKMKQRFNFEILEKIYEDANIFVFLNSKTKICCIFKHKNKFNIENIKKEVFPFIENNFKLKILEN